MARFRRAGEAWAGVLAVCAALATPSSADDRSWQWTPEAVVDTTVVSAATIAPDGGSVVFGRSRWRSEDAKPGPAWVNLWRAPFVGGEPQRLTTADAEDGMPHWAPDGRSLAFLSRRGAGDSPKNRIWQLSAAGGEASALSDEKTDVLAFEWSPNGRSIAYVAVDPKGEQREKEEKAGKDAILVDQDLRPRRLHVLDVAARKSEPLASLGDLSAWDFAWARDGSALAASVTERNRTDDSYMLKRIVVLPLSGQSRELAGTRGKVGPLAWLTDGRTIAWLAGVDASDPAAGSLFVVPAAGGEPRNLTRDREETAVGLSWRKDGRIALTSVRGTRTTVAFLDPVSGAWDLVLSAPPVVHGAPRWSDDGTRYTFIGSTAGHAPEVYAGSLAGAQKRGPRLPRAVASSGRADPQRGMDGEISRRALTMRESKPRKKRSRPGGRDAGASLPAPGVAARPAADRLPGPRALPADEAPKSAVELALERLRLKDREAGIEDRPLSDEQRNAIAEMRRIYEAKAAEREILYHASLRKTPDPDAQATLEDEYRRDRDRLASERDHKIENLRRGKG